MFVFCTVFFNLQLNPDNFHMLNEFHPFPIRRLMKDNSDLISKNQSRTCLPYSFSFIFISESYLHFEKSQTSIIVGRMWYILFLFFSKICKNHENNIIINKNYSNNRFSIKFHISCSNFRKIGWTKKLKFSSDYLKAVTPVIRSTLEN